MKVVTVGEKQKKCGGIGGRGKSWKFGGGYGGKIKRLLSNSFICMPCTPGISELGIEQYLVINVQ